VTQGLSQFFSLSWWWTGRLILVEGDELHEPGKIEINLLLAIEFLI